MRGKKAKKLRKAGLKAGPAERKELDAIKVKIIENRVANAKKSYYENRSLGSMDQFALKIREKVRRGRDTVVLDEGKTYKVETTAVDGG